MSAPLLARLGSFKTLRTWNAPQGTFGISRPLTLSLQRTTAYVDVLGLYPSYRVFVTDGGYGYVHDFKIHTSDWKSFAQNSRVSWETNRVEFIMPKGEILAFPDQVVKQQVGP